MGRGRLHMWEIDERVDNRLGTANHRHLVISYNIALRHRPANLDHIVVVAQCNRLVHSEKRVGHILGKKESMFSGEKIIAKKKSESTQPISTHSDIRP